MLCVGLCGVKRCVLYENVEVYKERSACQGCGTEVRNVLHLYLLISLRR